MVAMSRDKTFALSLIAFQAVCLIFFAVHFDTQNGGNVAITSDVSTTRTRHLEETSSTVDSTRIQSVYSMFMVVHVMIFVGFGFLMTFLRKYSLSAVSLNFLLAAMALQWGIITMTMAHQIGSDSYPTKIIDMPTVINGDFAAGAVLISFGALLGKTTPTQLICMTFLEVIAFAVNEYVLVERLQVIDAGGSMVIHTFGAFFGLAASWQFGAPSKDECKHNTSRYSSDIFSMIGTLFLWMFWPSFNAALVPTEGFRQERAVINTLLSIAASCVSTFVWTQLVSSNKKFDMVHIQNATLAGGVAMGAACELALNPASAITIGFVTGFVSVCGFRFLSPALEHRIRLTDTCGILNLHGLPGIIGGLAAAFATMSISDGKYGGTPTSIFVAREDRSRAAQGGYQLLAIVVTLGIALVTGALTGSTLQSPLFLKQSAKFEDEEWFHVPEEHVSFSPLSKNFEMDVNPMAHSSPSTSYVALQVGEISSSVA